MTECAGFRAVGEPGLDFSQIARPDWLTAQHTDRLRAGVPFTPLCAEDIGDCCAFSSLVGPAWVVVGEQPLLAAGVLVPRL